MMLYLLPYITLWLKSLLKHCGHNWLYQTFGKWKLKLSKRKTNRLFLCREEFPVLLLQKKKKEFPFLLGKLCDLGILRISFARLIAFVYGRVGLVMRKDLFFFFFLTLIYYDLTRKYLFVCYIYENNMFSISTL